MSGYFLLPKKTESYFSTKAKDAFSKKELTFLSEKSGTFGTLLLFSSPYDFFPPLYENEDNFLFIQGYCIYNDLVGQDAQKAIYQDFGSDSFSIKDISGHFTLLIYKNGVLSLFSDTMGMVHSYSIPGEGIYSSSFAVLTQIISNKTINRDGFYEYLFTHANAGKHTFIEEIVRLSCNHIYTFSANKVKKVQHQPNVPEIEQLPGDIDQQVEQFYHNLRKSFKKWGIDSKAISTGLTGGFDSRLVATLFKDLNIPVNYNVGGKSGDADVRIAKDIAEKHNLELSHFERTSTDTIPKNNYKNHVERQFFLNDGLGNEGIFDDGTDWNLRFKQAKKQELMLVGIGGEIFRNFWGVADKKVSIRQFVEIHYRNRYDDTDFTEEYDQNHFMNILCSRFAEILGVNPDEKLSRDKIELLYPLYRKRFWAGMEVSKTSSYYPLLLPFADRDICMTSSRIPLKWKTAGNFEALLVDKGNKEMASIISEYGFNFTQGVPYPQRMRGYMVENLPLLVRKALRTRSRKKLAKNKQQSDQSQFPYYLQRNYLSKVFDMDQLAISKYINIDTIRDSDLLSRALSVELAIGDYIK